MLIKRPFISRAECLRTSFVIFLQDFRPVMRHKVAETGREVASLPNSIAQLNEFDVFAVVRQDACIR